VRGPTGLGVKRRGRWGSVMNPATPRIFRVLLGANDLRASRRFYEALLGARARPVAGGRLYLDCGPVILGLLDRSHGGEPWAPPSEALYFATDDLESLYRRARRLGSLDRGLLHDDPLSPLGEIVVRPWGERSFYATDPSGNPLCFVDERTQFRGTPRQILALRRSSRASPGSQGSTPRPPRRPRARRGR
jgi:catechol 2,3-dioxygenase-like lactoylglutathione lyase family enzyme